MKTLTRALRYVRWYLGEVSGAASYGRFVDRHRLEHPGTPAPTRREYERHRTAHRERNPATRCC